MEGGGGGGDGGRGGGGGKGGGGGGGEGGGEGGARGGERKERYDDEKEQVEEDGPVGGWRNGRAREGEQKKELEVGKKTEMNPDGKR